jgi:hypothetical protein
MAPFSTVGMVLPIKSDGGLVIEGWCLISEHGTRNREDEATRTYVRSMLMVGLSLQRFGFAPLNFG